MSFKTSLQRDLDRFYKSISNSDFNIREVTKGALSQARAKLNPWAFKRLNEVVVDAFYKEASYYVWFDIRVLSIDGSRLMLPNHKTVKEEFGTHNFGPKADSARSLAMCSILYDPLNQLTLDAQIAPYASSERDLLMLHLDKIDKGDMLLLDRGYPCFWLLFLLQAKQENFIAVDQVLSEFPDIKYFKSPCNLKYFFRYSLAQHCDTKYIWILDDDIIPSKTWIETCLRVCDRENAIVTSNGRIIPSDDFIPELPKDRFHTQKYFIGDSPTLDGINICTSDTIVDYGCSSFFFKTEWQKYFWKIWPCTFQTGEDIHLSGTCKIGANIPTIVPKQESVENSGNLMPFYSIDEHASWKHKNFIFERKRVFEYLIRENKWNPLLWV